MSDEARLYEEIRESLAEYTQVFFLWIKEPNNQVLKEHIQEIIDFIEEVGNRIGNSAGKLTKELYETNQKFFKRPQEDLLKRKIIKICEQLHKVTIPL